MSTRLKLIISMILAALIFSGGVYLGYEIPRTDPQAQIQTVFTPYEDGAGSYLEFLSRAKKSVHIAAYSFTDERIADKLIELKRDGVKEIRILLDLSQTKGWSGDETLALVEKMRKAGIEVVIGTSAKYGRIMHHKYTVVDGVWVEDGSFNYSVDANRQANLLNFIKSESRARLFLSNWHRMYKFMKAQQDAREADKKSPSKKRGR